MDINTVTGWNLALGKAMSDGDGDMIMKLEDINNGWLQMDEEREARQALITGALDLIGW